MTGTMQAPHAPGSLELVRRFVNTRDVEAGTDRLATVAEWAEWARDVQGPAYAVGKPTRAELDRAAGLRESLRDALLAHHEQQSLVHDTVSVLNDVAAWVELRPTFAPDGLRLVTPRSGLQGVVGAVVAAVGDALSDGTWSRLKVCANDGCHWAFYDHSRSRTGRWCRMGVCGNRVKQARWRDRSASGGPSKDDASESR